MNHWQLWRNVAGRLSFSSSSADSKCMLSVSAEAPCSSVWGGFNLPSFFQTMCIFLQILLSKISLLYIAPIHRFKYMQMEPC